MKLRPYLKFVVLLAALCSWTAQAADSRRDGNWWRLRTETAKVEYVTGFFDGMELGNHFSYWRIKDKDGKIDADAAQKTFTSYSTMSTLYFKNVTNTQLSEGLDKFYEDYRNRSILIYNGVWLVVNSISGKSEAEMEKMIENFRKNTE